MAKPKTKKPAQKRTKSTPAAQKTPDSYLPRPVWGVIYGVLGVLALLTLVQKEGAVLVFFRRMLGGMIGYGLYVLPISLFALCILLVTRPKGPVRLRGCSMAVFPLLVGTVVHGLFRAGQYTLSIQHMSLLMQAGTNLKSGGLLAGGFYAVLEWAFSAPGALLLSMIALIASLLYPFMMRFVPLSTTMRTRTSVHAMKHRAPCRTSTR